MAANYDELGAGYGERRKTDPRIARIIHEALGDAQSVLNVGAGTGSYEPTDRVVSAVEPSAEMIRQRPASAARVVQASAERMPFEDKIFDASMAVLTVHHWEDKAAGFSEMRRVTRGPIVVLTFDPSFRGAWLTDYFPGLIELDETQMPMMPDYARWLGRVKSVPVLVPHDCFDGFLYAYWRRPEMYLDRCVRSSISSFWSIDGVEAGMSRLDRDIKSGEWARKHKDLLSYEEMDLGYRLVVGYPPR